MGKVRVGIIGAGNCASSIVQGVEYYSKAQTEERVPGLMHVDLGGYSVADVEFSCAFDPVRPGPCRITRRRQRVGLFGNAAQIGQ